MVIHDAEYKFRHWLTVCKVHCMLCEYHHHMHAQNTCVYMFIIMHVTIRKTILKIQSLFGSNHMIRHYTYTACESQAGTREQVLYTSTLLYVYSRSFVLEWLFGTKCKESYRNLWNRGCRAFLIWISNVYTLWCHKLYTLWWNAKSDWESKIQKQNCEKRPRRYTMENSAPDRAAWTIVSKFCWESSIVQLLTWWLTV